jgi:predicted ABC-type ATPase
MGQADDRFVWDAGQFTITRPEKKGDVGGHPFHGNRYTGGIGGDGVATSRRPSGLRPEVAARTSHVMEQLLKAESEGKATNMPPNEHDPKSPGRYSPERQAMHDKIINQILEESKGVPAEHKAWIMGGLGGAGKTTLLSSNDINMPDGSKTTASQLFGINSERTSSEGMRVANAVNVNADDITERMAAAGMLPTVDHLAPMELSYLAHEEASTMSHELADRVIASGKNMIWDVTLGSHNSGSERIAQLKEMGYSVTGVFVDVSVDASKAAAMERYQRGYDDWMAGKGQGGRYVPPALIEQGRDGPDAYSKNRIAFDTLVKEGQFDHYVIVNNEGRGRRVESVG